MRKTYKSALLLASALAVASSAQAYVNGDLLVGFTGGSSDFIIDIGQAASLTLGQTWNLSPNLGTKFGVIGALSSGSHIYATSADSAEKNYSYDTAFFNQDRADISTIASSLTVGLSRTTTPVDTTGWTMQTAQSAGTPGNYFYNHMFNPNVDINSTAFFFDNSSSGTASDSFFNYNFSSGQLAFGAVAVPEPTTLSLFAGLGLLALVARRHLAKA